MNMIKIYVDYDDANKIHYYLNFKIVNELPKITNDMKYDEVVKIKELEKDCEQACEEAYHFNCYELKKIDYYNYNQDKFLFNEEIPINDYIYYEYVAIKIEDDEKE